MSNSEMLIPIKVLKNNESAGSIKQQFEEYIDFSGFSEIPTIDSLKELFTKENIQILNEVIRPGKDKKNWRLDLKIENNNKLTIWANSLSNNELECLFIGTENDSVRNKAKLAKIISGYFGCLL